MTNTQTGPEDLHVSEVRYRRLFESARDGILILDANTRRITDVNPFMVELLGYSHDEFIGKELWEIGLFKDKDESQTAFRELQESGYIRYEDLPLQTKAGKLW
ncbi:MAG TPA: PAS domain-containing protein, partial [Pyrinomonadaceae bacterium]|nr:PAS domain-containing protein [Pyrinomonadaceae bacterium]